jgi:hypothetical protein
MLQHDPAQQLYDALTKAGLLVLATVMALSIGKVS